MDRETEFVGADARGRTLPDLLADEAVVGTRSNARLDIGGLLDGTTPTSRTGVLYVTTRRLTHVSGSDVVSVELDEIDDASIAGDRLLVVLKCGSSLSIETRLLRQLAATLAALRAERQVSARMSPVS